ALYGAVKLRAAPQAILALSSKVNQYINDAEPWKLVKTDMAAANRVLNTALQAINALKVLWYPIIPHTCQQLHEMLGFEGQLGGTQERKEVTDARGTYPVLTYNHENATGTWAFPEL